MKNSIDKKIYFSLGILFIFVIWVVGQSVINNSYVVPKLGETFKALGDLFTKSHTYIVLGHTLLRLFLSISFYFVVGLLLAILSYKFKGFKWFIKPIITLLKTLPIAVVIILLWIMLGTEYAPYYIVGVVVLPIIYEAVLIGFENINNDILDEVKISNGISPKVIFKVLLPITFPAILTSLIQSIGLGLKVLVMAEYITQPRYSIGNEFVYYKDIALQMEYLFAWSILLIIFVLSIELLISYFSKKKDLVL